MRIVLAADQRPGPGGPAAAGLSAFAANEFGRFVFGETSPEPWPARRAGPPYSTQVAWRRQLNHGMVASFLLPISRVSLSSVAVHPWWVAFR